ncbi:UNVERIFIED_CONTAM: hypothetical protein Sradi_0184400 [Sesamum radiatum]|uniref:Uncharacterized protein n=1 Tax=Sesamum radiatum TaxID=300843 RepID=A0AAW2W0W3_SESRA
MSAFFGRVSIVVVKSTKFVRLRLLRPVLISPRSGQQALALHGHECLGYGNSQGVYTIFTLCHAGFLSLKSIIDFLEGFSSLFSFRFSPRPSLLDAWASSMLMYLAAQTRRTSNLVVGFLASDLKKSPSISPCEKALVLTSWVAEGTSKAAVLNLSKYSFSDSPSF